MKIDIPFNYPPSSSKSEEYVISSLSSAPHSGDGPFTKKCHAFFQETLGIPRSLLTTSCTHALEMAATLLDIGPGDEVIVPSFTFVSTANAFAIRGANIVFADIRPDTLNLDEEKLYRHITPKTKAVIPVHYAGVACEMESICRTARKHGIHVVEDNAHGLFGKYHGRWLGTFGTFATQSFHETKNFSCGEGGALLINDTAFADRAEIIREKGTNRSRFFRGQVDKYTWVDVGSSYLPSDILAALLYSQLEEWEKVQEIRKRIWNRYHHDLHDWASKNSVRQPIIPSHCEQAWHMYYLLLPDLEARTRFIAHMKSAGICCVFHYLPLHLSEYASRFGTNPERMYNGEKPWHPLRRRQDRDHIAAARAGEKKSPQELRGIGYRPGDCPVTEDVSDRLVRLPMFNSMTQEQQKRVIAAALEFST